MTEGDNAPERREVAQPEARPTYGRGMFGNRDTGDTSGYGRLRKPVPFPVAAERPYGEGLDEIADALQDAFEGYDEAIEQVVVHRGEITFHVKREKLLDLMKTLRDEPSLRYEMCLGVSGVHYPMDAGRELHLAYPMLSITHNRRIRVEVSCPDAHPHVPSLVEIYPGNNWHERETYDFFGVVFDGHPALTRIQMPDDWVGHPQRKDYPLGGIAVEYKGASIPPPDERRAYN